MPSTVPLPKGSITALATPFTDSGELDLDAWQRLLRAQRDAGTQGVVVAGSTGEAATLYDAEYDALLRLAVQRLGGQVQVIAGTGLSSTAKTIEQTRRAAAMGADAALVVTPPYVRPTQAGLVAHYTAIADDGALPLILYNVPSRTGCDMLPATVAVLALHPRIVGVKEAVSAPERIEALLDLRSSGFTLLSGDDPTAARALLAGAGGVISVASNVVPSAFRRLCDLAAAGNTAAVSELDGRLRPLYDFLNVEPNPIPVKAILARQGIGSGLRLPLQPLGDAHLERVRDVLAAIDGIESSCRDTLAA